MDVGSIIFLGVVGLFILALWWGQSGGGPVKRISPRYREVLLKPDQPAPQLTTEVSVEVTAIESELVTALPPEQTATFAAGCFWGIELAFQRVPGVRRTSVGYTGGRRSQPTYAQICGGSTGHAEAVEMVFDPRVVSFNELLAVLWSVHNPTTLNRSGNDRGTQYRSVVFYHNPAQQTAALASAEVEGKRLRKAVVTQVVPAQKFWLAERKHQKYLQHRGQEAAKGCTAAIRCYG
jgi:methionine-S-sulfoxide reductase